jgi:hypothetical protein
MGSDNGKTNRNVPLKESYQPAELLQRGYQPKVQMTGTPEPPHVGSATVIPSAKPAPATQQK